MKLLSVMALAAAFGLKAGSTSAAEHIVEMLNRGPDGTMVFAPGVVHADVGDTITFKAVKSGHYVKSYAVPEGAEAWSSPIHEDYSVTLTEEGLYLYACPPHIVMAMVGIVQVGKPTQNAAFDEAVDALEKRFAQNKDRLSGYIEQLEK